MSVFDGRDLSALKDNELADLRRTQMGFIFQQPTLLKNLNLLDNIILPSMRNGRKNGTSIAEKAKTLMAKTGIGGLETREITQASGGQLQRVGICRALMSDPKILFGDEPTGALNSQASSEIHETCWPRFTGLARRSCWSPMMSKWPPGLNGCFTCSMAKSRESI